MKIVVLLAALALCLAVPAATASLPVGCGYGGPCVIFTPPSGVPSGANCREIVTTVGTTIVCTVGDGKVGAAAYGCQYCLPLVLADCTEGTGGEYCSNGYFALS